MTRLQDHNPLLWSGKPSVWDGDTNLPETLQRRLGSLTVRPPTDAGDARKLLAMCGLIEDGSHG